jgi:phage shock protein C
VGSDDSPGDGMTRALAPRTTYELRRSRTDRKIAGVLGGFAQHFDIDPTLVRVGYLLSAILLAGFPGVLVYLVLWLIIPEESYADELTDDEFYDYDNDYEDDY